MIKVKYSDILTYDPDSKGFRLNNSLSSLMEAPFKSGLLKYTCQVKLRNAITNAVSEYDKQRQMILESHSKKKTVKFKNGRVENIYFQIVDAGDNVSDDELIEVIDNQPVEGRKTILPIYDIEDSSAVVSELNELINSYVELPVEKIKLSKLENEDCSKIDFSLLENFIEEDL